MNLGYDYYTSKGHNNAPMRPHLPTEMELAAKMIINRPVKPSFLDFYLNYVKEIESINSRIDVTGGYHGNIYQDGSSFVRNGDETQVSDNSKYITENYLVSLLRTIELHLQGSLFSHITLRDDGSSRFAKNRWGLFPAAALFWKMKEEAFLKNVIAVFRSEIKIGLGYHRTTECW